MGKKTLLTTLLVLFIVSAAWAADSKSFSVSITIPLIPGVNAPPFAADNLPKNKKRLEVTKNNKTATEGVQIIEKEETKEILLAQGEKVTTKVKTIYTR